MSSNYCPTTRTVFIAATKSGTIWDESKDTKIQRNPLARSKSRIAGRRVTVELHHYSIPSPLLTIINSIPPPPPGKRSAALQRPYSFNSVCFAHPPPDTDLNTSSKRYSDVPAILSSALEGKLRMAAVDQRGCIWVFDFKTNKYWLITRTGIPAIFVSFNPSRPAELIIAFSDRSVKCYDVDTKQSIAHIPPSQHTQVVQYISTHPDLPWAITSTAQQAILWDTTEWTRIRVLVNLPAGAKQKGAHFTPRGGYILTYSVTEILIWDVSNFDIIWRLVAPPDEEVWFEVVRMNAEENLLVAAGGAAMFVWDVKEKLLIKEVEVGEIVRGMVDTCEFVGNTMDLLVVTTEGNVVLIESLDAEKASVRKVFVPRPVRSLYTAPDYRFFALIPTDTHSKIEIWDLSNPKSTGVENGVDSPIIPDTTDEPNPKTNLTWLEETPTENNFTRISTPPSPSNSFSPPPSISSWRPPDPSITFQPINPSSKFPSESRRHPEKIQTEPELTPLVTSPPLRRSTPELIRSTPELRRSTPEPRGESPQPESTYSFPGIESEVGMPQPNSAQPSSRFDFLAAPQPQKPLPPPPAQRRPPSDKQRQELAPPRSKIRPRDEVWEAIWKEELEIVRKRAQAFSGE